MLTTQRLYKYRLITQQYFKIRVEKSTKKTQITGSAQQNVLFKIFRAKKLIKLDENDLLMK